MTENIEPDTNSNPDEAGWVECPTGEISGMLNRLARQRKMAASAKISAVVAVLLIGAGVWQSLPDTAATSPQAQNSDGEYEFGEICCSEVAQYAAAFQKGELDEEKTAQISQHIAECPHCGKEMEKVGKEPQTSIGRPDGPLTTAALTHSGVLITAR